MIVGSIAVVVVVLMFFAALRRNPKLYGWLKESSSELGISPDNLAIVTIGIIVFNLVSWGMIPWWWKILTYSWGGFVIFNVGLWLVLCLRTIKAKGKDGENTDKEHPGASRLANIVASVLVVGLATTAWQYFQRGGLSEKKFAEKMAVEEPIRREDVLRAICMAESNCQQFEPDGTVLRGRVNPDDIGMFQINRKIHAKLIAETKLDPDTLDGNIRLANILYDKYGTVPWNRSRSRWIKELGRISPRLTKPFVLAVIEVPTDNWSDKDDVKNPLINQTNVAWEKLDRTKGGECEVMLDGDPNKVFPMMETHNEFSPLTIQFKCAGPSAQIRVRIVPNT